MCARLVPQWDHTSMLATAKTLFGLPGFLTKRDAWAGSFEELLLDSPRSYSTDHVPLCCQSSHHHFMKRKTEQALMRRCSCRLRLRLPNPGGPRTCTKHPRTPMASQSQCAGSQEWTCSLVLPGRFPSTAVRALRTMQKLAAVRMLLLRSSGG